MPDKQVKKQNNYCNKTDKSDPAARYIIIKHHCNQYEVRGTVKQERSRSEQQLIHFPCFRFEINLLPELKPDIFHISTYCNCTLHR